MREHIQERAIKHALLFIKRDATVRSVAKETGFSKATVHLDITERLKEVHPNLYQKCQEKIKENNDLKHLKGGYATQEKWLKIKERKQNAKA